MTTRITWSVLYALEVDPPIVEFTHGLTKDEVSSALIPCPLPQDVKQVSDDVLIMIRSGVETAQPDPVQRPDVVVPKQDSRVQCFVATMVQKIVVMSKQSTLSDEDKDEWTDVLGVHYSLSSSNKRARLYISILLLYRIAFYSWWYISY